MCSVSTIGWRAWGERQDVRALRASEDAVLMLDDHHVVAPALEHAGRRRVVAALVLLDPVTTSSVWSASSSRTIATRSTDATPIGAEQRVPQVARERPDAARARRIGGDDRDAHARSSLGPNETRR